MGQPPAPEERTTRLRQRFAGFSFGHAWRLTLFVAVIVTAAFGGLDTVDKQVTPFKPGEEFSDGENTVTIERARLVDELKGTYATAKPGKLYLGVVATVRNDGTVPGRLRDEVDLRDVQDTKFVDVFRLRDGSSVQTLGPGLSEQLVFAWLLPDSAAKTLQSVKIRVWKKKYTQLMVTYGGKEWIESVTDYGQTDVPVMGSS
jgi:hypothetical protein